MLKVLLLDDDIKKAESIQNAIYETKLDCETKSNIQLDTVHDIINAKILLKITSYDIFLLDVQIPNRQGQSPKKKGGVDLLKELNKKNKYILPSHIIGITSYDDIYNISNKDFSNAMWTLLKYDVTSDDWKEKIQSKISYIFSSKVKDSIKKESDEMGTRLYEIEINQNDVINGYTIKKFIGKGGNGFVYEALSEENEKVALKFYCPLINHASERNLTRFKNEASFLKTLDEAHIIKVFDMLSYKDYPFFVMEFCAQNLHQFINNCKLCISKNYLDKSFLVMLDICKGVEVLHKKQCWHRDLKPKNILIGNQNLIKIADFGIAHLSQEDFSQLYTLYTYSTERLAAFFYCAPEQTQGDSSEVDHRADIFALGRILYEILSKKRYSGADPLVDILEPSNTYEKIFDSIDKVIRKTQREDKNKRYQTVQDFVKDLQSIQELVEQL